MVTPAVALPTTSTRRRALIVGAGIAGLAAASALAGAGWDPVIVERRETRRRGGYFIAMHGCGRIAARRLGLPGLRDRLAADGNYYIDRQGATSTGVGFQDIPGKPWMMVRGDVEQSAFEALPSNTEIRFATTPTQISQNGSRVDVTLYDTLSQQTTTEPFELVIGADGIRSTVRRLVWGPDQNYLKPLGFMIAAFELPEALPGMRETQGAALYETDRSLWLFPFSDRPPTALFSWAAPDPDAEYARVKEMGIVARLRQVFQPEPLGPILQAALRHLEQTPEAVVDSVQQTVMKQWHRGRVVLLGDAGWCPTLYTGLGATSALAGADLLGQYLQQHPDNLETALWEWEQKLRPAVAQFQQAVTVMRSIFIQTSDQEGRKFLRGAKLRKRIFGLPLVQWFFLRTKLGRYREGDLATVT